MVEKAVLTSQAPAAVSERHPLKVLVLASKAPGLAPNQRFRFEQWAPRLARDHGIHLDLVPFESPRLSKVLYKRGHFAAKAALVGYDFMRRASVVARARSYDAVLVSREAALVGPAIYERLLAWSGKPIIYDFDDSIWSPAQARMNGLFSRLHFYGKTSTICRLAAAVTPGNEFLADYARRRNAAVTVIPTSIELDDYPIVAEPPTDGPFVVCWTGSTSTLAHFEHARQPLETLAKAMPLALKVICNEPPERPIAGAEMRFVPWSVEREAQELGDCHAGIMPLPDDEVARGKCGLKALQYMATGRPVVVSPVGVNIDIIQHGRNGLLASSPEQFVGALKELAKSPERRRQMGVNARATIERSYSAEVVARAFAEVVRSVVR
jgi:glycosyltransferase involved in cell wall biosynthesis